MVFARSRRIAGLAAAALLGGCAAAAAGTGDLSQSRLTVQGSRQVQVYLNGKYLGKSADATRLALYARGLEAGDNVIALRASPGTGAAPYVLAELAGRFGRMGSSALWRALPAADPRAGGDWAAPGLDDTRWPQAVDMGAALPAGFPQAGPAHRFGAAAAGCAVVVRRAHVWVPSTAAGEPAGLGRGTTGGTGGEEVTVSTPEALEKALCGSVRNGSCTDTTPRIVRVRGTIDFTGREGGDARPGCFTSAQQCAAPWKTERLALLDDKDTHCSGKPVFSVSFDKAGAHPLAVGSNKTLIGEGNDATLRGKGLVVAHGSGNVVIRNLTIERINPGVVFAGDGITLDGADRVWIDHNRFNRIGRQMIVTGWGRASNVTISWNDFDGSNEYSPYCNGRHYWNLLLVGDGDTITFANNRVRHFSGRGPHAGGSQGHPSLLHLLNNHFEDGSWHALDPADPVRALVEGNHFAEVQVPIIDGSNPGYVWASLGEDTQSHRQLCEQALGRACVGNLSVPMPRDNRFRHDLTVLDLFRKLAPAAALPAPYPADAVPRSVPFFAGPGHL